MSRPIKMVGLEDAVQKQVPRNPTMSGCTYANHDFSDFDLVIGMDVGGPAGTLLDEIGD